MSLFRRLIHVVIVGLLLAVASSGAEERAEDVDPLSALPRVARGRPIRIASPEQEASGRYLWTTADSLFIDSGGVTRGFPLATIDRVWLRANSARHGLLIGGVVGSLLLATAYESGEQEGGASGALFAGFIGGALGGAVGSLAGLAVPRWHLRYERPDRDGPWEQPAAVRPGSAGSSGPPGSGSARSVILEVFGGYDLLGEAQAVVGGRVLATRNPAVHLGVELSRIAYADDPPSEGGDQYRFSDRTTVDFLGGPGFRIGRLRPHVLLGVGVTSRSYSVRSVYGYAYSDRELNLELEISPGVRVAAGRWGLLGELKYHVMAVGEYDDLLLIVGGASFAF